MEGEPDKLGQVLLAIGFANRHRAFINQINNMSQQHKIDRPRGRYYWAKCNWPERQNQLEMLYLGRNGWWFQMGFDDSLSENGLSFYSIATTPISDDLTGLEFTDVTHE